VYIQVDTTPSHLLSANVNAVCKNYYTHMQIRISVLEFADPVNNCIYIYNTTQRHQHSLMNVLCLDNLGFFCYEFVIYIYIYIYIYILMLDL